MACHLFFTSTIGEYRHSNDAHELIYKLIKMTSTFAMEPMIPSDAIIDMSDLPDLALVLEGKAAALNGMVKPKTAIVLEDIYVL